MRNIIVAAIFSSLLLSAETASAHTVLDRADPRVGSTVPIAPRVLLLVFTQNLEQAVIEVRNGSGARVDVGNGSVDKADPRLLRVGLKLLSPGTYKVHWRVRSVDTHTTEGSYSFRVGTE